MLSSSELEKLCILYAQRISLLYEFDEALQTISEDAKLVMSTELRHGITQVASGND